MGDLFRAELYYLLKNVRYYVFLAITVVGRIVQVFAKLDWLSTVIDVAVAIFIIILVLEFAHKDFKLGTMKNYVGSGVNLQRVYWGKLLTCVLAILILSLLNLASKNLCLMATGALASFSLANELLILLISIEEMVVVFFICSLIRSGYFALIVSALYFIGLPILFSIVQNDIVQAIAPFTLGKVSDSLISVTSAGGSSLSEMVRTVTTYPPITGDIMLHWLVPTAVVIALSFLGSFLYSKREVK